MDDLVLVGIMEAEAGKLSPAGSDTWAVVESAAELNPPGSPEFNAALPDLARQIRGLSRHDSGVIRRLIKLYPERKNANDLEEKCKEGWFAKEWRRRAVIEAARRKDQQEGRSVNLDMTVEEAVRTLVGDL